MFRPLLLAGLLATSIGSAHAAPRCPSGQIYRVTKKVCVDKAAAVREGVVSSRQNVTKQKGAITSTRAERMRVSHASSSSPYVGKGAAPEVVKPTAEAVASRSVYTQAAPGNLGPAIGSTSAPVRQVPTSVSLGDAASPFGALSDPWTSGLTSALSQYRFSLPLTTEN